MNTEKKPQINGHESPSHASQNITNNHAGKQSDFSLVLIWLHCSNSLSHPFSDIFIHASVVEGYMKTDDRMRLAKERREEREKSLGKKCPAFFLPLGTNREGESLKSLYFIF